MTEHCPWMCKVPKKKAILKRAISTYTHFKRDSPKKDMLEVLFSFFKESSKF